MLGSGALARVSDKAFTYFGVSRLALYSCGVWRMGRWKKPLFRDPEHIMN